MAGVAGGRLRERAGRQERETTEQDRELHVCTSGPGDLRYCFVMASAAQYASAPTVSVGLYDAFCGYAEAPMTKTLCTSQHWRKRLTTLVDGSAPMIAPPVLCVLWYCVTV